MKNHCLIKKTAYSAIAVISAIIICLPFALQGGTVCSAEQAEGYEITAQSDNLVMYTDMQTGRFFIDDKSSGKKYYSFLNNFDEDKKTPRKDKLTYGSELVVDYASLEDFSYIGIVNQANSTVSCLNKGYITVKKIDNGISVLYDFKDYRFSVPVEYTLENGRLIAKINTKKIREGKTSRIINISLLPAFGAADDKADGYIFVPDGSGALINFNSERQENKYSGSVYGEERTVEVKEKISQNETVRMPVFGICETAGGSLMGNITDGDGAAVIKAIAGNATFGNNICYSQLTYRQVSSYDFLSNAGSEVPVFRISEQKYSGSAYEVQYSFLGGSSGYMGLAEEYRKYLTEEKGLERNDNAALINLDVYGALETKANFLGIKYSKLIPLTKYDDIEKIYDSLKTAGISNPAFRYIGWQNDGITNKGVNTKSRAVSCLGGTGGLKKLLEFKNKTGVGLTFESELLEFRKSFLNRSTTTAFNKKAYQYQYLRSVYAAKINVDPWLLLIPDNIGKNAEKYFKSLNENISDISLSSCTNLIYSDFKSGAGSYRSEFPKIITGMLSVGKKMGLKISGEEANAYAVPYTEVIYKAPTSNSGYNIFDKQIPFYQIVLKGYTSMTVKPYQLELNRNDEFLKAVETGSALLFNCVSENQVKVRETLSEELYSSQIDLWQTEAAAYAARYGELYESVLGKAIISHRELLKNVTETVFENGVTVIVNFNYEAVKHGENVIEPRDFTVYREGEKKQ